VEDNNKANSETGECEQILGKTADTLKDLADNGDILGAWDQDSLADTEWDTLEEERILGEMSTAVGPAETPVETLGPAEILDTLETRNLTGAHEITVWQDANTTTDLADTADNLPLDEITVWQDANTTTDLADTTDLDSERELLSDTEMKDANTADGTDKLECLGECLDLDFPLDTAWDSLEECILEELDTLEDTKITETDMADLDNIPGTVKRNLKVDKDTLEDSLPTGEANPILGNARKDFPEDTEWEFLEEWEILGWEDLDNLTNMEDSKIKLTVLEEEIITLTDTEITSEKSEWKCTTRTRETICSPNNHEKPPDRQNHSGTHRLLA